MTLQALHQLLLDQPLIALFAIVASGFLLGTIQVKGVSLGSSGVLFTALLAGHLGYGIPDGIGTLGPVLQANDLHCMRGQCSDGSVLRRIGSVWVAQGCISTR